MHRCAGQRAALRHAGKLQLPKQACKGEIYWESQKARETARDRNSVGRCKIAPGWRSRSRRAQLCQMEQEAVQISRACWKAPESTASERQRNSRSQSRLQSFSQQGKPGNGRSKKQCWRSIQSSKRRYFNLTVRMKHLRNPSASGPLLGPCRAGLE